MIERSRAFALPQRPRPKILAVDGQHIECDETDGVSTCWLKIRNPEYSQMTGRRELFERWRDRRGRDWRTPRLSIANPSVLTHR